MQGKNSEKAVVFQKKKLHGDILKGSHWRIKDVISVLNTDGIWYNGPLYHGDGEGSGLGQWENDHKNCQFRMASAGAYEFIEEGTYHPVIRGIPNDTKTEWEWGDIYKEKAIPSIFSFTEEEGVKLDGKKI